MVGKNSSISLWRGTLGGVLGIFAKVAMIWIYVTYINPTRLSYVDNTVALFIWMLFSLPLAVTMGLIIAAVIKAINLKTKRDIGFVGRAMIGASLVYLLWVILYLFDNRYFPTFANRRVEVRAYALFHPLLFIDFGVIIGAIAGMTARRSSRIELR